jgi:hypothetical protein
VLLENRRLTMTNTVFNISIFPNLFLSTLCYVTSLEVILCQLDSSQVGIRLIRVFAFMYAQISSLLWPLKNSNNTNIQDLIDVQATSVMQNFDTEIQTQIRIKSSQRVFGCKYLKCNHKSQDRYLIELSNVG